MEKCRLCNNWITGDGVPYCALKPLYTETEGDHVCDEGEFVPIVPMEDDEEQPRFQRTHKRKHNWR